MTIAIRRLGIEDWSIYRAIRLEALAREPQVYGTALHQDEALVEADWRDRLANPDAGAFVVLDGDDPVGMAGWLLPRAANARHRATLFGVYLRAGHRRRGLARRLLEATIADASARVEDIELRVQTDNAAAIGLYRRLGFRIVATVPRTLKHAGRYHDEHVMLRGPADVSRPPSGTG